MMKLTARFILCVICMVTAFTGFYGQSFAQTQTNQRQAVETRALEATPPLTSSENIVDNNTPHNKLHATDGDKLALPVSLIDDEIREKFDALKAAERDFLEASRKKLLETKTTEPNSSDLNSKSKGFIPTNAEEAKALLQKVINQLLTWLTSVPFLAQVGAVIGGFIIAPILSAFIRRIIPMFKTPPQKTVKFAVARDYIYQSRSLLGAACLVGILAFFAMTLGALPSLGQVWLVKLAQSLAVVFLLYKAIKQFIPNPLFEKVALWTVIPVGLMMVFGFFDDFQNLLNGTELMRMGGEPITLMTVLLLVIFGSLFAKIGNMVNARGQTAIRDQDTLEGPTREVVAKIFQILLFIVTFVLVLGAAKVPLSGLVVIFSALSLGIGLGLQPIAANFVSGLIILFDRSVKVGDFVKLPDGREGLVDAINMRSTIVETYDGKDVMVPNTKFTEDVYENWTHKDPRQRYEVHFTVSYDTDVDRLEGILMPEVLKHHQVLTDPEMPDLELREFGEYGIKFAIEFWCDGVDDGANKFTSDLNFIVWRTLKKHGISMPLPQREVKMLS